MSNEKLQDIQIQIEKVLRECKTFETCKDGSHKACLFYNGYYDLQKEKNELLRKTGIFAEKRDFEIPKEEDDIHA